MAKIYLSDNSADYRLGNQVEGTLWGARRWNEILSTSLRASITHRGNIEGADDLIIQRNGAGSPPPNLNYGEAHVSTSPSERISSSPAQGHASD